MLEAAATMVFDGEYPVIITDKRHARCLEKARNYGFERLACAQARHGFLNDQRQFISREDAAKEAYKCGQIKEEKSELFSEDLW